MEKLELQGKTDSPGLQKHYAKTAAAKLKKEEKEKYDAMTPDQKKAHNRNI